MIELNGYIHYDNEFETVYINPYHISMVAPSSHEAKGCRSMVVVSGWDNPIHCEESIEEVLFAIKAVKSNV